MTPTFASTDSGTENMLSFLPADKNPVCKTESLLSLWAWGMFSGKLLGFMEGCIIVVGPKET